MKGIRTIAVIFAAICFSFSVGDLAAQTEIQEAVIEISGKETTIYCLEGKSGRVRDKNGQQVFKQYRTILRARRKKAKAGNAKAKKQVKKIRKLRKQGDQACSQIDQGEVPKTQPGATPTPEPNEESYFETNGDVTALGVQVFEIPSGIQANAFRGQTVWDVNCTGCHEKRGRPTYPLLREAILQSPMFYTEELLSVQDGSDLAAFLNLFRTPQTD